MVKPLKSIEENLDYAKYCILNGCIPKNDQYLFKFKIFFAPFLFNEKDILTSDEISDVESSLKDIENGDFIIFDDVEECINWLKK